MTDPVERFVEVLRAGGLSPLEIKAAIENHLERDGGLSLSPAVEAEYAKQQTAAAVATPEGRIAARRAELKALAEERSALEEDVRLAEIALREAGHDPADFTSDLEKLEAVGLREKPFSRMTTAEQDAFLQSDHPEAQKILRAKAEDDLATRWDNLSVESRKERIAELGGDYEQVARAMEARRWQAVGLTAPRDRAEGARSAEEAAGGGGS